MWCRASAAPGWRWHGSIKQMIAAKRFGRQDVDEPWPLEVFDHGGRAHQASLQPGEMLLYEGATCAHGRTAPLHGRFMANVFVHFMERTADA